MIDGDFCSNWGWSLSKEEGDKDVFGFDESSLLCSNDHFLFIVLACFYEVFVDGLFSSFVREDESDCMDVENNEPELFILHLCSSSIAIAW